MQVEGFGTLSRLGTGGLGDVYRATRLSTGAPVAIKVLRDWSDSSTSWHRARRELRALVDLQGHPNVVHVEEVVEMDGIPMLVMEFAPGGSVADLLQVQQRLTLGEAVLVGEHTASALAASHQLGIIHLDIKPQNLLIGAFGQVKVCDFGIAALTQTEQFKTRTSAVSYRYASPEQLNDEPDVGAPADVYSLGATLAHLVNGAPLAVITGDATRARRPFTLATAAEYPAEAASAFEDLVNECLRVDPATRPTASDAHSRLAEIAGLLADQRSRALPIVVAPLAAADHDQMVPRVVTSPTYVSGPAGATVPRAGLGAVVPGPPGATGQPPVDPTVVSQPYAQPVPHYGYVTHTGQGTVPVGAPPPHKRSSAVIAAMIAAAAAVIALAAVGYVLVQDGDRESASASPDPRDDNSAAADDDNTDDADDGDGNTPTATDAAADADEPAVITPIETTTTTTTTTPTTTSTTTTSTTTTTSSPSTAPTTTILGDLAISGVQMARPECDDSYITIVGSAVDPDRYEEIVRLILSSYLGSQYLRTDQTCPSLRADLDGAPIYVGYFGPYRSIGEACDARSLGPEDAYVRVLSMTVPPTHVINCP